MERLLDQDMLLTSVGWVNGYYQGGYQDVECYRDEWGVTWKTVEYQTRFGKGKYTEPMEPPLADDRSLRTYSTPDPDHLELYAGARRVIRDFKDEYWLIGVTPTTIGVIYTIIPELIEIGADILDSVQPAAMDPLKLKHE